MWKKVEHWLVVFIIVSTIGGGLLAHIFAVELGLLPQGYGGTVDGPADPPICSRC